MTGYGRATVQTARASVTVELRSTNHRYLEIEPRLPGGLSVLDDLVTQVLRSRIRRGRIEAFISVRAPQRKTVVFDHPLLHGYYAALGRLRREFGLPDPVTLTQLLAVPQAVTIAEHQPTARELRQPVRRAVAAAAAELARMRRHEGARLVRDLRRQARMIERHLGTIRRRLPQAVLEQRRRLQQRLRELLGTDAQTSAARMEQAVAVVKEADVHEEAVRLESHLGYVRRALAPSGGGAVGKRLDFIAQELLREANTMGAKVNDAAAVQCVVGMKGCIEKIREQVQNLE